MACFFVWHFLLSFFFWFWFVLDCFTEALLEAKFSSATFVEVSLKEKLLETLGNHY